MSMKLIFAACLLSIVALNFAPLELFGMVGRPAQGTQADTVPPKVAVQLPKSPAKDYNYSFAPSPVYQSFRVMHTIDSATQKPIAKRDSSTVQSQVSVIKEADEIEVREGEMVLYHQALTLIGVSTDGANTLFYRAKTKDHEILAINPALSFVAVIFKTCPPTAKIETDCDSAVHTWGDVNAATFLPR